MTKWIRNRAFQIIVCQGNNFVNLEPNPSSSFFVFLCFQNCDALDQPQKKIIIKKLKKAFKSKCWKKAQPSNQDLNQDTCWCLDVDVQLVYIHYSEKLSSRVAGWPQRAVTVSQNFFSFDQKFLILPIQFMNLGLTLWLDHRRTHHHPKLMDGSETLMAWYCLAVMSLRVYLSTV